MTERLATSRVFVFISKFSIAREERSLSTLPNNLSWVENVLVWGGMAMVPASLDATDNLPSHLLMILQLGELKPCGDLLYI